MAKTLVSQKEFDAKRDRIVESGHVGSGGRLHVRIGGKPAVVDGRTIDQAKREVASILEKTYRVGEPQEVAMQ